ncbi:ATP-dependent Clp protease ATP-binding subunit ClpA [Leclercia adecarboxylata]|uniref:ATP-dependent Clp protease ATP-binding subunit ClpA n=1 Tax=Leclercia adecarboxylata TaxID=83655 RepID=A0A4U9HTZ8_9ENTR|nr:ATP-dependent Clp protease ATP-binding subunit ClpA [Leclercia adecarboxylata]
MRWVRVRWARVIQDNLKKPLANELLFGSLVDGGQVTVALDQAKNELTYDFQSAAKHKPKRLTKTVA